MENETGIRTAATAGADEHTPSVPQYFSWINNTNEGSTEAQTLVNLDFFRYMKERFGMQIRIYAWDAGNFDGAAEGYGDLRGDKFRAQYPEGYRRVVEKAKSLGVRMGLWGSPDGFGDDPETQRERFDFFVHLCRDYHFALFKLDGVCGRLRPEKAPLFAEMLRECRRYSPDLIVLNHRLELYEAAPYVTTNLWNGNETYVDVHAFNRITCMHNRAYMFSRGRTPGLTRLTEDHGVCISSSPAYFEDDLVYQAFGRSLILAPELYGNPWFLRDDELPKLARVYNLHGRNAAILTEGMALPAEFGCDAVSRGTGDRRFLCTGHDGWTPREIRVPVGPEIGLTEDGVYDVILRHPAEALLGSFRFGENVTLELQPFRATLLEISASGKADPVLTNCVYEVVTEDAAGAPTEIRCLRTDGGQVELLQNGTLRPFGAFPPADAAQKPPVFLGALKDAAASPARREALFEAAQFAADNDALEVRAVTRAGKTAIPEVRAAREAFFAQKTYRLRGCENAALFDGDPASFFDAQSRTYCGGFRADGGCLRVDAGGVLDADEVRIEVFSADRETKEVKLQLLPDEGTFSADLAHWTPLGEKRVADLGACEQEVVRFGVHTTYMLPGRRLAVSYPLAGPVRYLRIPRPMDRIFSVSFLKNGRALPLPAPRANNLQPPFAKEKAAFVQSGVIRVPAFFREGSYLAVAVHGRHGCEGVCCTAETDGVRLEASGRAADYRANVWEHVVASSEGEHTFFIPLPAQAAGKDVTVYAVFSQDAEERGPCDVWLCPPH